MTLRLCKQTAVKEEKREARRVKKEIKGLYQCEAQRAQKAADCSRPIFHSSCFIFNVIPWTLLDGLTMTYKAMATVLLENMIPDAVVFYHIWWMNLGVLFNSFLLIDRRMDGRKGRPTMILELEAMLMMVLLLPRASMSSKPSLSCMKYAQPTFHLRLSCAS
ncbi:hypothetical protein NC652_015117 [Populus alba x Populus x berolinensis]|nr:hypothetical protein NC652_015117 [Populus alba x Populus x berolinensis]